MGIFGKSKRTSKSTSSASASASPHSHSTSTLKPQSGQAGPYLSPAQPSWTYVEQFPNTSQNHGSAESQGWLIAPIPPQYQPVLIPQSQLNSPLSHLNANGALSKLNLSSVTNLLAGDVPECVPGARYFNNGVIRQQMHDTHYFCDGVSLCDRISSRLNTIITLIDGDKFSGDEAELAVAPAPQPMWQQEQQESGYAAGNVSKGKSKGMVNNSVSSALVTTNYFAKVHLYANSRLPPDLPPMKLYIPTFPLLCLAAQYSERVYSTPSGQEKDAHVEADWRHGTKAMVLKSVPMDDMNTIVFAIRGTQTFMDWAVNLRSSPVSPERFLDDPGNLTHAGFLNVARKMVQPVAARLRNLLQENPNRSNYSLLITGHSAGGAVAALLYSHMLATSPEAESELNILTGCFKRVHCVTFGAPPVSLLPLQKPSNPALKKSLFLSFVNEGDPVARADKAYIRSLLDLYSTPAPGQSSLNAMTPQKLQPFVSRLGKSASSLDIKKARPAPKKSQSAPMQSAPLWPVPEAALSNAGRIVLLRSVERYEMTANKKKHTQERMDEGVIAQMISDALLRGVIWGDPVCHMMKLYARRIEVLATNAVMGRS